MHLMVRHVYLIYSYRERFKSGIHSLRRSYAFNGQDYNGIAHENFRHVE